MHIERSIQKSNQSQIRNHLEDVGFLLSKMRSDSNLFAARTLTPLNLARHIYSSGTRSNEPTTSSMFMRTLLGQKEQIVVQWCSWWQILLATVASGICWLTWSQSMVWCLGQPFRKAIVPPVHGIWIQWLIQRYIQASMFPHIFKLMWF